MTWHQGCRFPFSFFLHLQQVYLCFLLYSIAYYICYQIAGTCPEPLIISRLQGQDFPNYEFLNTEMGVLEYHPDMLPGVLEYGILQKGKITDVLPFGQMGVFEYWNS